MEYTNLTEELMVSEPISQVLAHSNLGASATKRIKEAYYNVKMKYVEWFVVIYSLCNIHGTTVRCTDIGM